MNQPDFIKELADDNPGVQTVELRVFMDALKVYREATTNIDKFGTIVLHPRTSQPLENPYLKVQTQKGAVLAKMRMIESNRVLEMLDAWERDNPPQPPQLPDL